MVNVIDLIGTQNTGDGSLCPLDFLINANNTRTALLSDARVVLFFIVLLDPNYFSAACAAARRAIGTRKGEQET